MTFYLSMTLMVLILIVQLSQQSPHDTEDHPTNWRAESWAAALIVAFLWPVLLLVFAAFIYMSKR